MTKSEFRRWLNHHTSRFTTVQSWLSKFPASGTSEHSLAASQEVILDGWFRVLGSCDLNDAIQATDRIHAGLATGPNSFDEWPSAIALLCRADRSRRMDAASSERYRSKWKPKCEACQDEGVRFGILQKTLDEAVDNATLFAEHGTIYEGVYACERCDKGRIRSEQQSGERKRVQLMVWQDGMIDACNYEWVKASYQERREIVAKWARSQCVGTDFISAQEFD